MDLDLRVLFTFLVKCVFDWVCSFVFSHFKESSLLQGKLASYFFLSLLITHFIYEGLSDEFVALVFSIIYFMKREILKQGSPALVIAGFIGVAAVYIWRAIRNRNRKKTKEMQDTIDDLFENESAI